MNPVLVKYRKAFLQKMKARSSGSHVPEQTKTHDPLQETFLSLGINLAGDRLYLKILYCPRCLYGRTVDMVREIPDNGTNARKLQVINKTRQWTNICNVKEKPSGIPEHRDK